jgi:hypothetical protein
LNIKHATMIIFEVEGRTEWLEKESDEWQEAATSLQ